MSPTSLSPATEALSHLAGAKAALQALVDDPALSDGGMELVDLATVAHAVDALIGTAREVRSELTSAMAAEMGEQQAQVGPWRLECHQAANRKRWASDSLLGELAARSTADPATGEKLDDGARFDRFYELVRACVPFTGSLGWRAGALREVAGLNPDEWCEVERGRLTVSVHVAEPESGEEAA